jgi:hypothetical protein
MANIHIMSSMILYMLSFSLFTFATLEKEVYHTVFLVRTAFRNLFLCCMIQFQFAQSKHLYKWFCSSMYIWINFGSVYHMMQRSGISHFEKNLNQFWLQRYYQLASLESFISLLHFLFQSPRTSLLFLHSFLISWIIYFGLCYNLPIHFSSNADNLAHRCVARNSIVCSCRI